MKRREPVPSITAVPAPSRRAHPGVLAASALGAMALAFTVGVVTAPAAQPSSPVPAPASEERVGPLPTDGREAPPIDERVRPPSLDDGAPLDA